MTEEYERGFREGQEMLATQVGYLNDQVQRVAHILTKAVFVQSSRTPPKPGMHIWLIFGVDMITTGYYLGDQYLADGGAIMEPTHWCMIPPAISGEIPSNRRIVKPD